MADYTLPSLLPSGIDSSTSAPRKVSGTAESHCFCSHWLTPDVLPLYSGVAITLPESLLIVYCTSPRGLVAGLCSVGCALVCEAAPWCTSTPQAHFARSMNVPSLEIRSSNSTFYFRTAQHGRPQIHCSYDSPGVCCSIAQQRKPRSRLPSRNVQV